jgi:hypothetical protein
VFTSVSYYINEISFDIYDKVHFFHFPAQDDQGVYQDRVRELIRSNSHRLVVNVNDLRRKNAKRAAK